MSKITELLIKFAQEEQAEHKEYLKDFSTATMAHLVQGGLDREKAASITKEACLRDETLVKSVNRAFVLEKVAEYIDQLESDNAKLQVKISEMPVEKQAEEQPEAMKKLASIGFTAEEMESLKDIPESVLDKVAAVGSQPWELGHGAGPRVDNVDPLLSWILT